MGSILTPLRGGYVMTLFARFLAAPLVRIAAIACLALCSTAAGANDRYVATNGSDKTGTGAVNSPFATLNKANTVAKSGDRIILRAGNYQGWVRIRTANLTVMSAPGERATVSFPPPSFLGPNPSGDNNLWAFAPGLQLLNLDI